MVIDSYLFSAQGKAAPVNPNNCHLHGKVLPICHLLKKRNSCLKKSAKIQGTNIILNGDNRPATQSICNAKMGKLQAACQRGLIAYFSGPKLFTRMKRTMKQSSHEKVESLGTAARDAASRRSSDVQTEANLTASAKEGGEARVQVDAAIASIKLPDPKIY